VQANDDGRADWSWVSPVNAQPGIWQAVARGRDTGIERSIFFEIAPTQAAPSGTEFGVNPDVGGPRTTFAFFATGYDPDETITYWVMTPEGREIERDHYKISANEEGRVDWFWRPPVADEAIPGQWQMIAFGKNSQLTQVIPFQIEYRPE
jgi:hypothetical protein